MWQQTLWPSQANLHLVNMINRPLSQRYASKTRNYHQHRVRATAAQTGLLTQQGTRLICGALHRRDLLHSSAVILLHGLLVQQQAAVAEQEIGSLQQQVLRVGPQQQYQTIAAAVAAALPGSSIVIDPGRYNEQLVVTKTLKLEAAQEAGSVEVVCDTQQPYQHCLEVNSNPDAAAAAAEVTVEVEGIKFSHYSKSVANNYCIFVQSGQLLLQSCDISSRSGVGLGVEGAAVQATNCSVHDCSGHGVAVYGALEGGVGRCQLVDCSIASNKLNGVLVRDGGELHMTGCSVQGNGGYGVQLQDCSATLTGNSLLGNRAGAAALQLATVEVDLQQLEQANKLDRAVQLL